jgi:predicted acylesterase/phospholipase RssA
MFDAVVFAGGGNRCYWHGGFYEAAVARLGLSPRLVVGTSAGAFAATYSLLGMGPVKPTRSSPKKTTRRTSRRATTTRLAGDQWL